LIKTVLALKHQLLPPSLHFEQPNPHIDFANSPFYVNTKLSEWKAIDGTPRRAGVSSFGIGGTNAHVILEEAPISEPSEDSRPWQLLVLSAKTESALETATANLSTYLEQHPESNIADVAYTLIKGRQTFSHRRMLVCQERGKAIPALRTVDPKSVFTHFQESADRSVVFMFSGQGTQYVNMGLELYQTEPTFREKIDFCAEYLKPHLGFDLRQVLYPSKAQISEAEQQLKKTAIIQPALFVIEYALAKLWMAWGVQPDAMIGHSIGEYVAACLSGVFTLEEALSLIVARGQFMQQLPSGAMLSVSLSESEVQPLLGKELSLAAHNTPFNCVVSGASEAIETIEKKLTEQGVECCRLRTFRAFHSKMMEPILDSFTDWVKQVRLCPPQIPYLSNVTGSWITAEEALNHRYWTNHLRQTVRFADGIQELLKKPERILLEVGPGRTLSTLVKQHPDKMAEQVVLSSLRHMKEEKLSDGMFLLNTLGKLWLAGGQVDWSGFYAHEHRYRIPLPTYPFEHQRYWIDSPKIDSLTPQVSQVSQASLDKKLDDIAEWFYRPFWKPSVLSAPTTNGNLASSWLVFEDASGLGAQLVKKLEQQAQEIEVITVQVGSAFSKQNSHNYTLNPQQRNDYDALVNELQTDKKIPQTIVHLWCVTQKTRQDVIIEEVDKAQELGFYSLLFLTQALGKQNVTDEISIAVVSNNMQAVTGEEALHPEKSTVLGPIKVIGLEYPNLSCRSIDVIIPPSESGHQLKLIEQLQAELTTKSSDRVIAYRGEHRWVQDFEPVHLDKPIDGTPRLRENGVYLITGGLGGIGLTLAEHLAKTVQAKLILIGRSAFPAKAEWHDWLTTHDEHDGISSKIKKVQALETQGAEVLVISADVADLPQMQKIITIAKQRFGSINGVIHSAGVPDGALIPRRTREMTETVFAPKVTGTLVLDHLLQDVKLDFFILCSSISSIFGIGGQIGYCAANAFLDTFAHFKNNKKDRLQTTVAINWDTWQEVGMAVKSAKKSLSVFDSSKLPSSKTREVSHPLFNECLIEGVNQERYISHLNVSQHWVLDDHRIMGKAVLPGTAYLELARAAFEPHVQSGMIEIRDIYFLHPLVVEDNESKEVHTCLTKQGNSLEFEFVISSYSAPDTWQEHARGFIACIAAQPAKKHDIKAITYECDQQEIIIDPEFAQKPLAELSGFETQLKHFGPHWYNLQRVKLGTHQGLAFLELPKDFVADLTDYQLHPALLDIATVFLKFHAPDQSSLPFYYKRLTIKAPLPAKIYSYVRHAHTQTTQTGMLQFNVTLMDEQGMELVDIEEFTLRKVEIDTATYQQYQAQREKVAPPEKNQNFHLEIVTPGLLDTLTFIPTERHQPKPDEVEIEICATGLNFKEVLYAVGLLQAPADFQVKFGLECAGRIVTVGNNVKDFQVNDEIIAFASASFSAFTTTPATSIVPKPNNLSFEEAATIPLAFVTAYYALIKVGRLSKGERILIHAAAGGVGMAAVKIAQWMGAEIFATAGNPEKRAFLHSLGIQYVMDSRSLAFADEVMEYTKGKGVDVVLNSLGGEFIPKSLETLAPFGRFLELGIRDIHNNTQLGLRPFEKGLTYSFISVGQETPHFPIIFQEVVQHFNEGHFSPIPYKVFPATDVASAFDYMAQTKHIGKIVVSFQDKDSIITQNTETLHSDNIDLQSRKPFVSKLETKNTAVTNLVQQNLKEGLLPIEGVDVFDRILGSRQSQVIVSTRDIHSRLEQNSVSTMLSSLKNAEPAHLSKPTHSRPQLGQAYIAPRNDIEQKIADIWQQFLGVEQVGIYDDFFDLGGNSLLAVQLIAKLREVLQIDLSVQSLLNTSTVAALAEFLGETTPELSKQLARQVLPSSLVEIQAGNSLKSPLFLVHPVGGNVYLYRDLAHCLGSEIPVYGIQAQGWDGEIEPLTRVEEMATHYIEAMRVRQPEGPYFIGGSSFGGMVAFEMAQQLHRLDQKVALLTMMDTLGPGQFTQFETDEEILAYTLNMGANVSVSLDELRKLEPDEQLRYALEKQKKMEKQLLPDMDITQARHFVHIFKANAQAMWAYKPRFYQDRIIFFRAKEKDAINAKGPERAWINLATEIEVIDVPGNHFTMHSPPHVQVMAERLIPYLA
jgi:acyl transferase domain-containing protein/NADPH:quinone reductase-like Zn-dependent oxidoreductase/thioesterase domain-containing protein/acyl carrier protein